MVYFKVLPSHSGVTERNRREHQSVFVTVRIKTENLMNASQNCYDLSQLPWLNIRGLYFFPFICFFLSPAVETD
jgi:hypothetical protein